MLVPWVDRNGRFSILKASVFAALFLPAIGICVMSFTGPVVARPAIEFNHRVGLWAIRFLMVTLAITPLRQILKWPKLIIVRRMIGVATFLYLVLHVSAYVVDKDFNFGAVFTEIVLRFYLTIGFGALAIIAVLASTSTDGMLRRLGGKRWQKLHRTVYLAAFLGIIHYFLQMKLDVAQPEVFFGLFLWLMGYRLIFWRGGVAWATAIVPLILLSLGAAVLTGLGEAAYFHLRLGIPPERILHADFIFIRGPRPAWIVLFFGLGTTALSIGRKLWDRLVPPIAAASPAPR